jgi:hypothetical protein
MSLPWSFGHSFEASLNALSRHFMSQCLHWKRILVASVIAVFAGGGAVASDSPDEPRQKVGSAEWKKAVDISTVPPMLSRENGLAWRDPPLE